MCGMEQWRWSRLADVVRTRRQDLGMSQRELAQRAGTTDRLVSAIERAERDTYGEAKLRAVSRALGWTPDSIARVLDGQEPEPAVIDTSPPTREPNVLQMIAELQARVTDLEELVGQQREDRLRRRPGRRDVAASGRDPRAG